MVAEKSCFKVGEFTMDGPLKCLPLHRAFLFVLLLFLNILPESGVLWLSSGGTPESESRVVQTHSTEYCIPNRL